MGNEQSISAMRGFDSFEIRLGDHLRGERATLGKSLLDVQRDLRIKAAYVAAIENCDPDVFPNKGFIAGYVRSYARYLGLDGDEVFARFSAESGFDGVNASLTPKKRVPGQKMLSGPMRVDRDDPLFRTVIANRQMQGGGLSEVSFSALGSFVVLIGLVSGLAYGGYLVLADIQRVEMEPVAQRPAHLSDMVDIVAPGLGTETVMLDPAGDDMAPPADIDIARLYQPRELEIPVLSSRDGPIVDIDPDQGRPRLVMASGAAADAPDLVPDPALAAAAEAATLVVREEPVNPGIRVVAQRPAWVRIYLSDGTIIFEKILETGEAYVLPKDLDMPMLRAGNAGSVFLALDQTLYGPVGSGTGVAKNISLLPGDVSGAFTEVAEVPDALRGSVAAVAAELEQ